MWTRENDFDTEIRAAARKYGVPAPVIKSVIAKESGFNPGAIRRDPGGTSRGLMQIIERTAQGLGYVGPWGDDVLQIGGLYEPDLNIQLGTQLLAQLMRRYPGESWDAIYAAYNSGAVRRNSAGNFINTRGNPIVENHVAGFRRAADHFGLDWRQKIGGAGPFVHPGS